MDIYGTVESVILKSTYAYVKFHRVKEASKAYNCVKSI